MKISKSLLQAILIGATVGVTTSCEDIREQNTVEIIHEHTENCDKNCMMQTTTVVTKSSENNCMACGMG